MRNLPPEYVKLLCEDSERGEKLRRQTMRIHGWILVFTGLMYGIALILL